MPYDREIPDPNKFAPLLKTELDELAEDFTKQIDQTNALLVKTIQEIEKLRVRADYLEKSDRYVFQKTVQVLDGRNIQLGTGTGTRFGTATGQKIGFFNAVPIIQVSAISAPSGGATVDAEARTAINSIRTALTNLGLTA